MSADDDPDIPDTGAVFSFGKSNFADNIPSKFWIRNDPISQLACGDQHTAILTNSGRVFVFGSNDSGQLGQGFPNSAIKPTCVKALKHEQIVKIVCGKNHTLALTENGNLYGFGGNKEGQLGANNAKEINEPVLITNLTSSVQYIDCGAEDSAVLTKDGRLYLIGNTWNKTSDNSPLELMLSSSIELMACGDFHISFVTTNNKLYIIGPNERPKLDIRIDIEQQLASIDGINEKIIKLSCGGKHTAILTANGKLYTLGDGIYGQLGVGTRNLYADSPMLVSGLEHIRLKDVVCGENHVAVISENGSLFVFGDGSHGKLGLDNENFANQFWPAKVLNFKGYSVEKVSCGGHHMMVLAKLRMPEEIELYGEEDVEPFRSGSADSNDVVVSTARSRRHKRDTSSNMTLPPLKFPGKQLDNLEIEVNNKERLSEILSVREFIEDKKIENEKPEKDGFRDELQNEMNLEEDGDDVSEIVNFTDISGTQPGEEKKIMFETIESGDEENEDEDNDKSRDSVAIPEEVIQFVNTQVNVITVSNQPKKLSSLNENENESEEEDDEDEIESVSQQPSASSSDLKGKRINSRNSSISSEKLSGRKASFAIVSNSMYEDTETEDEESDESEVEESEVTKEIANDISEKDLQEASNSKQNDDSVDKSESENKRKKKSGKTVFNRMFGKNKSSNNKNSTETEKSKIPNETSENSENKNETNSPLEGTSPSKEPVPFISQSSLLCSKKLKLTQQENNENTTENQSVTCALM